MARLKDITAFLDTILASQIDDASHNGLQVQSSGEVKTIGFAVDACMDVFRKAQGCDMIITHHGLFWNKKETLTGNLYHRIKFLIDNDVALYSSHLPLDAHPELGNNAQLFRLLGAKPTSTLGSVGLIGKFPKKKPLKDIVSTLNKNLGARCRILKYGSDQISTIAIVSGGGQFQTFDAIRAGVDLFISGEISHSIYNDAKEAKLNVIGAGHYATETAGVKALMPIIKKKFNVKTIFIDNPTGL